MKKIFAPDFPSGGRYLFSTILIFALTFSFTAPAQQSADDNQPTEPPVALAKPTTPEQDNPAPNLTRLRRAERDYFVHLIYSPLDLLIPSKLGGSIGLIRDADKTWELEYLKGSVSVPFILKDLGSMDDERFSLTARSYFGGNSFNVSYGFAYNGFSLHLGDEILNRVSGGNYPSIDLVKIGTVGAHFGFGNRWIFNHNVTLGVDWFAWSQPIFMTERKSAFLDHASNENDYKNVDDAIRVIAYMPRWTVLKIQLGILF